MPTVFFPLVAGTGCRVVVIKGMNFPRQGAAGPQLGKGQISFMRGPGAQSLGPKLSSMDSTLTAVLRDSSKENSGDSGIGGQIV